jgi:hypothetical protein
MRTIDTLTLSIVSGRSAVLLTALMECFFGLTLVTNKLRTGLLVLGLSLVGIMSPPVLFFGDLFPGTPTLEPQRPRGFYDGVRVSGGDTPGAGSGCLAGARCAGRATAGSSAAARCSTGAVRGWCG